MNRSFPTILAMLFVSTVTVSGVLGAGCFPSDVVGMMECADDACGTTHACSCNDRGLYGQGEMESCLSIQCPGSFPLAALTDDGVIRAQHHISEIPSDLIDPTEFLKQSRSAPQTLFPIPGGAVSLLLKTCSFLS